jgi:hypothetical protein
MDNAVIYPANRNDRVGYEWHWLGQAPKPRANPRCMALCKFDGVVQWKTMGHCEDNAAC